MTCTKPSYKDKAKRPESGSGSLNTWNWVGKYKTASATSHVFRTTFVNWLNKTILLLQLTAEYYFKTIALTESW